jgi:hypothetical protein
MYQGKLKLIDLLIILIDCTILSSALDISLQFADFYRSISLHFYFTELLPVGGRSRRRVRPSVRNEGTEIGLRPTVLVRRRAAADDQAGGRWRDAAQVTQERRFAVVGIRIPKIKLFLLVCIIDCCYLVSLHRWLFYCRWKNAHLKTIIVIVLIEISFQFISIRMSWYNSFKICCIVNGISMRRYFIKMFQIKHGTQ